MPRSLALYAAMALGALLMALPAATPAQTGEAQSGEAQTDEAQTGETQAAPDVAAVVETLSLPEVFDVMEDEGAAYGESLRAEMFPDAGGASWDAAVAEIYSAERVLPEFIATLGRELEARDADLAAIVAFFSGEAGRKAISLEVSARRALLDEAVEDAAKLKLQEMQADRDPRLDVLEEFVATNDLVEANVTGGLNSSLAFYRGLASAGAFGEGMSESDMLNDVWNQEAEIRADTEEWVYSMLAMAYAPLTDAELRSYIEFSRTEAGQDLNAAMFAGFDVVFTDISHRLGVAAGAYVAGQDI